MKNLTLNSGCYDVAIIGGGPAGMMAAISAGQLGRKVVLIEKNHSFGQKLLLTGNGRCNITQKELENRLFLEKLGGNGKFLLSALSSFGPQETIDFFQKRGLSLKIEKNGRVFPISSKSEDVLNTLTKELKKNTVTLLMNQEVLGFEIDSGIIQAVKTKSGPIHARNFILATGGKSYSFTGSTGESYRWLQDLGHSIAPIAPALVPVRLGESWLDKLQGLSFQAVKIKVLSNKKKISEHSGDILFTHFGISGPTIINASKEIGKLLQIGGVTIEIDFKPEQTHQELDQKLKTEFEKNGSKFIKNYLSEVIPQKLSDVILKKTKIEPTKKLSSISKRDRGNITELLKSFPLTVLSTLGFNQAMITSGGVNLKEIDSKTMQSKIIKNLFLAGEVLDLDGPTGGYNLQIAWTTGYIAGKNATDLPS